MRQTTGIVFAAVLLAAGLGRAADEETIELAPRYTDTRHGFSLCPPAGSEATRETSAMRLVSWRKRDEKTKAIAWTLTVMQASEGDKQLDLNAYQARLVENLRTKENFQVDSAKVVKLAGREAIDLAGVTAGQLGIYARQVWVRAEPGKFLIIKMTGSSLMRGQLDAICDKVLGTLELIDPKVAEARREESLARGRALLASLTDEKLAAIVHGEPQWFIIRWKDNRVGFMKVVEAAVARRGRRGCEVKTWLWQDFAPGQPTVLVKVVTFATADRKTDEWTGQAWAEAGDKISPASSEEGARQADKIVCTAAVGGKVRQRSIDMPEGNVKCHLPKGMDSIIWRLMDLKKEGAYAFSVYNAARYGLDRRTLTVVGPGKIKLAGSEVEAIRATDQAADDAGAENTWLNSKGLVVRAERGDLVMTAATRDEVLEHFPKAESIIAKMGE
ncbi:MAG TPA: hypothetical protein VM098_04890 [Phycisphaerae bacterium]|nr:hypothetical protein [Phycisphaerae bacterium]